MKKYLLPLAVSAIIAGAASLYAVEKPVIKIGIVSDVQGLPSRHDWGMRNLVLALDQLKTMQIDTLLNLGDLAEGGYPETYKLYWELVEERFGKEGIVHIGCDGNHDFAHPKGTPSAGIWEKICSGLRRSTANPLCINVRGYDFIILSGNGWKASYPQETLARLEETLKKSVARDGGKPIFLLSHYPPADTMSGCFKYDGAQNFRKILNRYPQVVALSGHTHYPLNDERCLWQGEFSAFTCGTLAYGCLGRKYFNCVGGILPYAREAAQFLRMDVFDDRIEIHRYNAIEGKEIAPEKLWRIALPYDPAAKRPVPERFAPEFAASAQLLTRYDYGYMYLLFDRPVKGDFAHFYDVEITEKRDDGTWVEPVVTRYAGDFYRLEKNRQDMIVLKLRGSDMKAAAHYRIRVYPVESYGKRGKPLEIMEYTWPGYSFKDGTGKYPQE